jgi:hypothetical protein
MGILVEAKALVEKYPLSSLGLGAVALAVTPVLAVSMAGALRPWAKRIVLNAIFVRREALRVFAESKEGYVDLVAEALRESDAGMVDRYPTRRDVIAVPPRDRVEPLAVQRSAPSVA